MNRKEVLELNFGRSILSWHEVKIQDPTTDIGTYEEYLAAMGGKEKRLKEVAEIVQQTLKGFPHIRRELLDLAELFQCPNPSGSANGPDQVG